ncbi:arylamine N-acetyltransferase [Chromohalobacter sp. 296-RDG]|uniref:arylamine N-acetyltransferase family protein n=1 Tax=Chromohalobacter sp. 296-RDG TaxID=2994062 RepID=UPI00246865BB|nr:arylamine N-acetyltransferase [Chromohalobacter sp. 296-RDG]
MSASAAEQAALPLAEARVLVLGRSEQILETVLTELRAVGITAEGTATPETAPDHFDARDYDLISLGRGLLGDEGQALKAQFQVHNPEVRFLDTYAPFAAHQIVETLGAERQSTPNLVSYSARIGYEGILAPSLPVLKALHERHPDAIPFEAIDALLNQGVDLSPEAVEHKLVHAGRGGYCFEHNGLFKRVLEAIGFHVEGLSARVRWNAEPGTPPQPHTHMALRVTLDNEPWLVDVGFGGCVLTTPLRMNTTEPQPTQHETFRLIPFGPGLLLQMWTNDQWQPVYESSGEPKLDNDYEVANWYTATHPSSQFRRNLIAARTTPTARYTLLNGRFTIRHIDGRVYQETLDADAIEHVMHETFRIPVKPDWRPALERAAALTA